MMEKEHYFTLSWDTCGKDGRKRHYYRYLYDREKAIRRAKSLKRRTETDRVKLREMESWEEVPVTHISLIEIIDIN